MCPARASNMQFLLRKRIIEEGAGMALPGRSGTHRHDDARRQDEMPVRGSAPGRISVLRQHQVVPLLPESARAAARGARLRQPWQHTLLEHHHVDAIEIPEHEHDHVCLHLQLGGSPELEWWNDGRNRVETTSPGAMILLGAGTRDRLRWSAPSERVVLSLRPELLERTAAELGASHRTDVPALRNRWDLRDPALEFAVARMYRQAEEGFPLGALYAGLLEGELAAMLLRRHGEMDLPEQRTRGQLPLPRLHRAMEFLTANLGRDVRLEEAAAVVELSPFHFAREFRATTGHSPYQYLLAQRMDHARSLLRTTDWSVQEIAAQCGFVSAASFVRAFRQRVGATPGEWRKHV